VFASGLNPGQFWGFAELGYGIGFSLGEITTSTRFVRYLAEAERIYYSLPMNWGGLMLDMGAVQEHSKNEPISPRTMDFRMDQYLEAARRLPGAVFLVTPDKVGDQIASIGRFTRQLHRLRKMLDLDATLLLALQPGERSLAELDKIFRVLLGAPGPRRLLGEPPRVIPAFPMRGTPPATPIDELVDYVRTERPSWIHLLGMGPANKQLPWVLRELGEVDPDLRVSLDASLVRGKIGAGRPWTEEKPRVAREVRGQTRPAETGIVQVDVTEWQGLVSGFTRPQLAVVAQQAGLSHWQEPLWSALTDEQAQERFVELVYEASDPEWRAIIVALQRAEIIATPKFQRVVPQRDRRLARVVFDPFEKD
jgi:hypothetical protein